MSAVTPQVDPDEGRFSGSLGAREHALRFAGRNLSREFGSEFGEVRRPLRTQVCRVISESRVEPETACDALGQHPAD